MNTQPNQLTTSLLLLVAASSCLVSGQFLPQSHLGRLVQSITSPLMLTPAAYRETGEAEAPYPDPSSYYPQAGAPQSQPMPVGHPGAHIQPEASRHEQQTGRRLQMLQQAPSQQRGVPQQYYGQPMSNINNGGPDQDGDRDQGAAPSNNKQRNNPDYQMGAYLGPTIDDKEINGAFNSNDDRDEDDGPSSYDGVSGNGKGMGPNKAASNAYNNDAGYNSGADESYYGGQQHPASSADGSAYGKPAPNPVSSYDEDGADEDEPVQGPKMGGGRQAGRAGLSRAASHYQQQGSYGSSGVQGGAHQRGPLMAAANGYAPFGYAGPVDLTGLMAGVGGDPNAAAYQVYSGDGSYPGANYYQQQHQPGQRGGRNQAASMNNYNANDGYGPGPMQQGAQRGANGDNDDHEGDADDD